MAISQWMLLAVGEASWSNNTGLGWRTLVGLEVVDFQLVLEQSMTREPGSKEGGTGQGPDAAGGEGGAKPPKLPSFTAGFTSQIGLKALTNTPLLYVLSLSYVAPV